MSSVTVQLWLAVLVPLIIGILFIALILARHLFRRTKETWRHRP